MPTHSSGIVILQALYNTQEEFVRNSCHSRRYLPLLPFVGNVCRTSKECIHYSYYYYEGNATIACSAVPREEMLCGILTANEKEFWHLYTCCKWRLAHSPMAFWFMPQLPARWTCPHALHLHSTIQRRANFHLLFPGRSESTAKNLEALILKIHQWSKLVGGSVVWESALWNQFYMKQLQPLKTIWPSFCGLEVHTMWSLCTTAPTAVDFSHPFSCCWLNTCNIQESSPHVKHSIHPFCTTASFSHASAFLQWNASAQRK